MDTPTVHLLDYVAGNVRSLVNAIEKLGFSVMWVKEPADISKAEVQKKLPCSVNQNIAYNYPCRDLYFQVSVTLATAYLSSLVVDILSPSVCIFSQTQFLAYASFLGDYKNSKIVVRVFHKLAGIQRQL
jgi:hypothetical protein